MSTTKTGSSTGASSAGAASTDAAKKFDPARAAEYEEQSRIALAGYQSCHELCACLLAATLGAGSTARILVVGAGGTGQEILTSGALEPNWHFTAVDPSQPMLDLALANIEAHGLSSRVQVHLGAVEELPSTDRFDAATLIGVLHHLPGDQAKQSILQAIAARLKPKAPFLLAGNRYAYASQPLLLQAWAERWRMHGASADEVETKLAKILQGADPPHSEAAVADLLMAAGFASPLPFFSSLFWGAWVTHLATS
jgi:tRNA (cmo5U34)-methyltransferase